MKVKIVNKSAYETPFYATEKSVSAPIITLELKDNIDNMFQYLRTGDAAFLGYMTDQNHRDSGLLGKTKQHSRGLLDLCHRTG